MQIDRLLGEAEEAAALKDWETVRDRAEHALTFDPQNADGIAFLAAADRALSGSAPQPTPQAEASRSYTGCYSCGADWSHGQFSEGCEECGGGGLERLCLLCGGQCGSYWKRAILDSHDFEVAHWAGFCALPEEEQKAMREELMAIMEEKARQTSSENL